MEKEFIIDGHRIVLCSPDAYERTLRECNERVAKCTKGKNVPFITRILDNDQVVVEKAINPKPTTGQYFFAIKTRDGVRPPKHVH